MPTYDYECKACGHTFERFQAITASPVRKCPRCGKKRVRRLPGAGGGIIFKGSGFYATDYRSDSYRRAAEKETPASAGGKAGGSADAPKADKKTAGEKKQGAEDS